MISQGGSDPQVQKIYYRIGEAATITGVLPSVIRYWETEFRTLRPTRSRSGQRTYTQNDIRKIRQIKHLLYDLKFTIEGAKKALRDGGAADIGVVAEMQPAPPQALPQALPQAQPQPAREKLGMQDALVEVRKEAAEFLAWLDGQAAP